MDVVYSLYWDDPHKHTRREKGVRNESLGNEKKTKLFVKLVYVFTLALDSITRSMFVYSFACWLFVVVSILEHTANNVFDFLPSYFASHWTEWRVQRVWQLQSHTRQPEHNKTRTKVALEPISNRPCMTYIWMMVSPFRRLVFLAFCPWTTCAIFDMAKAIAINWKEINQNCSMVNLHQKVA